MAHLDIIRAWKDPEYRLSLSEADRAHLLENPAGSLELTDAELELVGGSTGNCLPGTIVGCCILCSLGINMTQAPCPSGCTLFQ
jgi:mersacidin/lichenicidin family type 2 lantibiotic